MFDNNFDTFVINRGEPTSKVPNILIRFHKNGSVVVSHIFLTPYSCSQDAKQSRYMRSDAKAPLMNLLKELSLMTKTDDINKFMNARWKALRLFHIGNKDDNSILRRLPRDVLKYMLSFFKNDFFIKELPFVNGIRLLKRKRNDVE
jgi:hypothetical protein